MIPMQRRNAMHGSGPSPEVCEGCGVLMYAAGLMPDPRRNAQLDLTCDRSSRTAPAIRWILPPEPDRAAVCAAHRRLHLPETVCRLIAPAGSRRRMTAKRFSGRASTNSTIPHPPRSGIGRSIASPPRYDLASRSWCTADYDVDGMCSTSIMLHTLRLLGWMAIPFIPERLRAATISRTPGARRHGRPCEGGGHLRCGTSALEPVAALNAPGSMSSSPTTTCPEDRSLGPFGDHQPQTGRAARSLTKISPP